MAKFFLFLGVFIFAIGIILWLISMVNPAWVKVKNRFDGFIKFFAGGLAGLIISGVIGMQFDNNSDKNKNLLSSPVTNVEPSPKHTQTKNIQEWASVLKGKKREEVIKMLGKPDSATEYEKTSIGLVRYVQYAYRKNVISEHTGKIEDLYIMFDWDNTKEISVGYSGKKIELMF